MMRGLVPLALLAGVVACGGSVSPTSPSPAASPIAPANLQVSGDGHWMACLSIGASITLLNCDFQGELRNVGNGCATAVHGVTRFYSNGQPMDGSFSWTVDAAIVQPNQVVTYRASSVSAAIVNATMNYQTEPAWTNVPCPPPEISLRSSSSAPAASNARFDLLSSRHARIAYMTVRYLNGPASPASLLAPAPSSFNRRI